MHSIWRRKSIWTPQSLSPKEDSRRNMFQAVFNANIYSEETQLRRRISTKKNAELQYDDDWYRNDIENCATLKS